ncbi:MAG: hypothetical protein Q9166_002490 [cf. Caloplaca sp. 2 TL-2023]
MTERRRRSSASSISQVEQDRHSQSSNPNVFSDEYALDYLAPSDGFRPQGIDDSPAVRDNQHLEHTETPSQQSSDHTQISPGTGFVSRKPGVNERPSSILFRHDGARHVLSCGRATTLSDETPTSTLYRSASQASTFTMPRTQSPYQGATGPSQPYGMYLQDIGFSRTPSMATTSTVRPQERSYAGPSGPAQPYGMYPQYTVPEDDIGPVQGLHPPLPVGFPGRSQDYRRRLGPGAEDVDDLVGPDGYTEQLPPYTRYPYDIPPKEGAPGPASILSAERGESGRSEETLMNPFQSREALPQSRDSIPQHTEQHHSSTGVTAVASTGSSQQDQGGNFKERVKEKGKKRTCYGKVPFWAVAVLVLLMIAVLAGTIGGVVGNAQGEKHTTPTPPPGHRRPPSPAAYDPHAPPSK